MDARAQFEVDFGKVVAEGIGEAPPKLREAISYALFPGGSRWRPLLVLHVAKACGATDGARATASACAIEMMHAASLVHDDLPCFDAATTRRGKPTVHQKSGEGAAVLVGDALIVMAFDVLARAGALSEIAELARASGPMRGLIAGQAWELEAQVNLEAYHRAKTGALFEAAATMGAMAAGAAHAEWVPFGEALGLAYQAADDLADVRTDGRSGKTGGRDAAFGRPSAVALLGLDGAERRVAVYMARAQSLIPKSADASCLEGWMRDLERKLSRI